MPAPRIRGDYSQLTQIAKTFGAAADNTRNTFQRLKQNKETLQGGDWLGKGADKFYQEMDSAIFPALQRLQKAFSAAQSVTQQISQIIKTAETDAAAVFKLDSGAGAPGGGGDGSGSGGGESGGLGFLGQVGGFFEGLWEGAKGTVEGLWHAVTNPIDTIKGIGYAITHPGEVWEALKKPYVEDWQSGNYGRAIGRGAFEVAMLLIPGVGEAKAVGKGAEVANLASKISKVGDVADVARLASKVDDVARVATTLDDAARVAEVARVVAKGEDIAMTALRTTGGSANDIAIANDVFNSANKVANLADSPAVVSRFAGVDSAVVPNLMDNFGGPIGRAGDIPVEFADRRITTVGRLSETLPASDAGARILKVPNVNGAWSNELNALWVKEAVQNGDVFKLATGVTEDTASLLGKPEYGGISVYTRELDALQQAGYTRVGDYLIPPR